MEKENNTNKLTGKFWIVFLIICILLIVFIAIGFNVFNNREKEVEVQNKNGGNVSLNYSSNTASLSLENITPVTDEVGKKQDKEGSYFDFSVKTDIKNNSTVQYELSIKKDTTKSNIPDENIKVYLEKEKSGDYTGVFEPKVYKAITKKSDFGTDKGSMILNQETVTKSGVDNYRLRVWMDEKSNVASGNYTVEININAKAK